MKDFLYTFLIHIFQLFPITKKKILFISYYGSQYGCNPKYLSEYITNNHKEWKVIWAFTEPQKHPITGIQKVRYHSFRYFYELCTSQVLITNYRMTNWFHKRNNQIYIQTWHSSLRLKMIEKDAENSLPPHYVEMAKKDSLQIDYLLSGCDYSTSIFQRCFWYNGPILPTGTPRNDLLFHQNDSLKNKIKQQLQIPYATKVVLYAPTFRKGNSMECYNIDYTQLIHSLQKQQNEDWVILVRLHPHLRNLSQSLLKDEKYTIDATNYNDIQELLFISDVVISDYSSLIFDFAMTLRPCFLYVPDLEAYTSKDRALYFDIRELPFPISLSNEELCQQIATFSINSYQKQVTSFLANIGSYETGHACEKVFNYISPL